MPKHEGVSLSVIRRLPRYYRFLGELLRNGICRISSRELSQRMRLTASQIRQDLNCFGGFGQQGYGYNVELLHDEIGNILGIKRGIDAILIGAGNLGRAIATNMDFKARGFNLIGIFDNDPKIVGEIINGIRVDDVALVPQFCERMNPTAAILCIPENQAAKIVDMLTDVGIKCYWNFSHYDLSLYYPELIVEDVHLCDSLMTLCYQINNVIDD